jgi:hypothetical protein
MQSMGRNTKLHQRHRPELDGIYPGQGNDESLVFRLGTKGAKRSGYRL